MSRDVSYPVVRVCVAARKPETLVEPGRAPVNMFVSQSHRPGAAAEVDFGEVRCSCGASRRRAACSPHPRDIVTRRLT